MGGNENTCRGNAFPVDDRSFGCAEELGLTSLRACEHVLCLENIVESVWCRIGLEPELDGSLCFGRHESQLHNNSNANDLA